MKMSQNFNKPLQAAHNAANIEATTKPLAARCAAVNSAFFVPKIRQAWGIFDNHGAKNRNRTSQNAGGLIGLNTRPFHGNKPSCLVAVVETRPPVPDGASGQKLTKPLGGQAYA